MSQEQKRGETLARRINKTLFRADASQVTIEIAGTSVSFNSCSNEILSWITRYFSSYLAKPQTPAACEIYVELAENSGLGDEADPEFHASLDERVVYQRDFIARQDENGRHVALVGPVIDDAIFNLMRWTLPPLLLKKNAFLLHAAAVAHKGAGFVFFGQSGAGKTTTTKLISQTEPSAQIMGDDAVIIELASSGDVWAHAAPLGSSYLQAAPPNVSVPVARLFALRQDTHDELVELGAAKAAASLLASAMTLRFDWNTNERFELAQRFTRRGGIQALHFRKDAKFWNLILERTCNENSKEEQSRQQSKIQEAYNQV